jgi:hypothetical protein
LYIARFDPTANAGYQSLTPDQRRHILRIVASIQSQPAADGQTKVTLELVTATYTLYMDDEYYWVLYHLVEDEIVIVAVGQGDPYVPIDLPDLD